MNYEHHHIFMVVDGQRFIQSFQGTAEEQLELCFKFVKFVKDSQKIGDESRITISRFYKGIECDVSLINPLNVSLMNINDGPPHYDSTDGELVQAFLREKAKVEVYGLFVATTFKMLDGVINKCDVQLLKSTMKSQLMLNLSEDNINETIKELKVL